MSFSPYATLFSKYLNDENVPKEPKNLYSPMQYILDLGGKRIRPLLTLIAAEGFGTQPQEALPAAMAVEVFHNFTLLHDDIMDQAPIRRGKPTVHENWDTNTAILSGDMMMIKAYQYLQAYPEPDFKPLMALFTKTALEVCEGQQYDMDFEQEKEVSIGSYEEMIRLKTAVLLGAALQMGAIVAQKPSDLQEMIYAFGVQVGLAFQLQDDYLDTFGDASTFGKQIGGDIQENKKTWLYLKTLELANTSDQKILLALYQTKTQTADKIQQVQALFQKYKIDVLIQKEIQNHSQEALRMLENVPLANAQKDLLRRFVQHLETRNS